MIELDNYKIAETIHEGAETVLYRAVRIADGAVVTIKTPSGAYPTPRQLTKLRHEYAILKQLNIPGAAKVIALQRHKGHMALIFEDVPGHPLSDILAHHKLDIRAALTIAAAVAVALGSLHQRHIIHKDIRPQNILFDAETGQVTLIDFGSATRLSQEAHAAAGPREIEGALAYMSPEQTGRMNRGLDCRTDFYSLGITLYEMLTGVLPFQETDPTELMHSHIARAPVPPSELAPEIPETVSHIVMKLLAKNAEDRYQSGAGLHADLMECLSQWQATGRIAPFSLGRMDRTGELRITQRLYGREAELEVLEAALEHALRGALQLLLVAGNTGEGKSAFVHEIHRSVLRHRGYFIAGKFDEVERRVPYEAVAQAFRDLIRQILLESPSELAAWKERIESAVGIHAGLLIDLIPELEILLGPKPLVPELEPRQSGHHFAAAFQSFVRVFGSPGRPLIVFLDDLHWADRASLDLLEMLLTDPDRRYLLVIGAYRDPLPAHLNLDKLRQAGVIIHEIRLSPLDDKTVGDLLSAALGMHPDQIAPLAAIVVEKTGGNPFFINQFLKYLLAEELLKFDSAAGGFRWEETTIREAPITDNVGELMAARIERLSPEARRAVVLASCIGYEFDLTALAVLSGKSRAEVAAELWDALREGIIVPITPEYRFLHSKTLEGTNPPGESFEIAYRFLHDRVQQTAYGLMEAERKEDAHLRLGRFLLKKSNQATMGADALFEITNHMNRGARRITSPTERLELAQLNLTAGKRAKIAMAYEVAAGYLKSAAELFGASGWQEQHEPMFELTLDRATCEHWIGHFDEAEALFHDLLAHAESKVEQAHILRHHASLYFSLGKISEAYQTGKTALAPFERELPETPAAQDAKVAAELAELEATAFYTDAYQGYLRSGAAAKAANLAADHAGLLSTPLPAPSFEKLVRSAPPPSTVETWKLTAELFDVAAMMKSTQAIAGEIVLEKLLHRWMKIVVEHAGAERGLLLLCRNGQLFIEASMTVNPVAVEVGCGIAVASSSDLPLSIVHYVERTREPIVLRDASAEPHFAADPYILARQPKSVLCLSMVHQGRLTGILYLENNIAQAAFSAERVEILTLLSSHAAVAVENAILYQSVQAATAELKQSNERLEQEVARRTEELREANEQLQRELIEHEALQEAMARVQAARLAELSTPVIPITDRIMVMPLIGTMDETRARQMLDAALAGAQSSHASVVILDITGVKTVDSAVATMLMRTAGALGLLGTQGVITGIRPEVARTLVALGLDLEGIVTRGTLQSGIAYAMSRSRDKA